MYRSISALSLENSHQAVISQSLQGCALRLVGRVGGVRNRRSRLEVGFTGTASVFLPSVTCLRVKKGYTNKCDLILPAPPLRHARSSEFYCIRPSCPSSSRTPGIPHHLFLLSFSRYRSLLPACLRRFVSIRS